MNQRTKQCVRRMKLGDIASGKASAYQRALKAFDDTSLCESMALTMVETIRILYIYRGMDPEKGQRWLGKGSRPQRRIWT